MGNVVSHPSHQVVFSPAYAYRKTLVTEVSVADVTNDQLPIAKY